jgi:xanthine dehydrogenase YagT iron-sulfur-binding subunit
MTDEERDRVSRRTFIAATGASAVSASLAGAVTAPAQAAAVVGPQASSVTLTINGAQHVVNIEPRVTLLDAIRSYAGLTGTKKGCDQGTCGACTVMVNGRRINACLTLAMMHEGEKITTIEGIADGEGLHPMQAAMIEHDGFQCGFCTSGQIVSAVALLAEGHTLDRDTVRKQMSGNICRCGCYPHIVDAVLEAEKSS